MVVSGRLREAIVSHDWAAAGAEARAGASVASSVTANVLMSSRFLEVTPFSKSTGASGAASRRDLKWLDLCVSCIARATFRLGSRDQEAYPCGLSFHRTP